MQNPFYNDFYGKALIPAGLGDISFLGELGTEATHWFVAIEGRELTKRKYHEWRVHIFAADRYGHFNANAPIFSTPYLNAFEEAMEEARSFEEEARNDKISSLCLEEKIS
ncbi:hypothetical protein [Mesobacillus zeae]|uniref:Uncharacterized protein n=1 Tax=Mesobacillus zeae TaxID=1917180 RepID=A0A398BCJ9_9BACI|nr:hypothetical protein [Mesobacillus zeae]RID87805.1 hypothetical protein D1970_02885 [Mesobacillus zeae]